MNTTSLRAHAKGIRLAALLLIITLIGTPNVSAAPADLVFQRADEQTLGIVKSLLPGEIAAAEQNSQTPFGRQYPWRVVVARATLSASEPPYLFVMILQSPYCGAANCSMWGYEPTKHGWRKILESIGYQWAVLPPINGNHHDISGRMHGSAFEYTLKTYRWSRDRYQLSRTKDVEISTQSNHVRSH